MIITKWDRNWHKLSAYNATCCCHKGTNLAEQIIIFLTSLMGGPHTPVKANLWYYETTNNAPESCVWISNKFLWLIVLHVIQWWKSLWMRFCFNTIQRPIRNLEMLSRLRELNGLATYTCTLNVMSTILKHNFEI